MPNYLYKSPITQEIVEVTQGMNDVHEFFKDGIKYDRIFTIGQMSIDTTIDPFSQSDFSTKTGRKRGTVNDLFQTSAELSEKRAKINGIDNLKENYYKKYSEKRNGKCHPDISIAQAKAKLDKLGVIVE